MLFVKKKSFRPVYSNFRREVRKKRSLPKKWDSLIRRALRRIWRMCRTRKEQKNLQSQRRPQKGKWTRTEKQKGFKSLHNLWGKRSRHSRLNSRLKKHLKMGVAAAAKKNERISQSTNRAIQPDGRKSDCPSRQPFGMEERKCNLEGGITMRGQEKSKNNKILSRKKIISECCSYISDKRREKPNCPRKRVGIKNVISCYSVQFRCG